jgi:hypothetical protein
MVGTVVIIVLVLAAAVAVETGILAVSLFLVEDVKTGSFKEFGAGGTLGRCAGIVIVRTLLALIPFCIGFVLSPVVWFLGIMVLFQKTFGQTVFLFLLNAIISIGVNAAIAHILMSLLGPVSLFNL